MKKIKDVRLTRRVGKMESKELEKLNELEKKFSGEIEELRKDFIEIISGRKEFDSSYFEENFDIGSLKDAIANDIDVSDEIINKSGHPYVFGDRESVEEFWKEEYMHMYKAFWTLMYEYVNPLKHLY